MIEVKKLYDRLNTLTTSGTSGYFSADDFNSNLYSVQYAVLSLLCDNYEQSQKVSDYLADHIKIESGFTLAGGKLFNVSTSDSIEDYYRLLSLQYVSGSNYYPSYKVAVNEVAMTLTSSIRKPDLTKGRTQYYLASNNIFMLPKDTGLAYELTYCAKPEEAKIAFTTSEDEDNDYLVIDIANTVNIQFHEGLFNLFVYYMLESVGIELKESLIQEYSQLGIQRTTITDITS